MIDYSWVTEDTKPEFEAVLRKHGLSFLHWRARNKRQGQPLETIFKLWWLQRGPTGFKTTKDAFRFRTDLLEFVERTMLSEATNA